jgi:hypothetical protein
MRRADELVRLKRRIAEFEQCISEVMEPACLDCLSWSGPERAELEELFTRTLKDMRARRSMLEHLNRKQGPTDKGSGRAIPGLLTCGTRPRSAV